MTDMLFFFKRKFFFEKASLRLCIGNKLKIASYEYASMYTFIFEIVSSCLSKRVKEHTQYTYITLKHLVEWHILYYSLSHLACSCFCVAPGWNRNTFKNLNKSNKWVSTQHKNILCGIFKWKYATNPIILLFVTFPYIFNHFVILFYMKCMHSIHM